MSTRFGTSGVRASSSIRACSAASEDDPAAGVMPRVELLAGEGAERLHRLAAQVKVRVRAHPDERAESARQDEPFANDQRFEWQRYRDIRYVTWHLNCGWSSGAPGGGFASSAGYSDASSSSGQYTKARHRSGVRFRRRHRSVCATGGLAYWRARPARICAWISSGVVGSVASARKDSKRGSTAASSAASFSIVRRDLMRRLFDRCPFRLAMV